VAMAAVVVALLPPCKKGICMPGHCPRMHGRRLGTVRKLLIQKCDCYCCRY